MNIIVFSPFTTILFVLTIVSACILWLAILLSIRMTPKKLERFMPRKVCVANIALLFISACGLMISLLYQLFHKQDIRSMKRLLHLKKMVLYAVVIILLCSPLALAIPWLGYDLMTSLTLLQASVIVLSPVVIGALVLWSILWSSGRD